MRIYIYVSVHFWPETRPNQLHFNANSATDADPCGVFLFIGDHSAKTQAINIIEVATMAAQRTTSYTSDHDIQSSAFDTPRYLDQSASHLSLPNFTASGKRRLLLIYVHGFNGSEASFLGFPAHIHSLLTDVLAESHEVYTRIYPRYKSRGDMKVARDQFSSW